MKKAEGQLLELIRQYPGTEPEDVNSIIYCCSRIKSPESMTEKLEKRQLPVTCEAALHEVYDAVGIRVVCAFAEDVYQVVSWLADRPYIRVIQSKDYIASVSYTHLDVYKRQFQRCRHSQPKRHWNGGNHLQSRWQMCRR